MNIGIQEGLVDPKHEEAMGTAVFLFMWLVRCQTQKNGGSFVLGGMPLTYAEISKRSRFAERKIRRWMDRLRDFGYVRITYLNFKMMRIEILKAKKWGTKQTQFPFEPSTKNGQSSGSPRTATNRPETVNRVKTENGQSIRPKTVNGSSKNGQSKQSCSLSCIESPPASLPLVGHGSRGDVSGAAAEESTPVLTGLARFGITLSQWVLFLRMRETIKRPLTPGAEDHVFNELARLQSDGQDPVQVLNQAIVTSSYTLYPVREGNRNGNHESFAERNIRRTQEEIGKVRRRSREILSEVAGDLPESSDRGDWSRALSGSIERSKS